MANINVECPHCQTNLETSDSLIGNEVQCPACGKNFVVKITPPPEENLSKAYSHMDANGSSKHFTLKMETKTVFCPHCQSSLDTPVSFEGKEAQCPICKKNFTVIFQQEAPREESVAEPPQEYSAQQFFHHPAQSEHAGPPVQKENPLKIVEKKKPSFIFSKWAILLWMTGGCACLLLVLNILLGLSLFVQQANIEKLENRIQGLQTMAIQGLQTMAKDISSLASNTAYKPVAEYKIIDYTWEYPASMNIEFKQALAAGFEPAGYVCQNSIKGGMFLFVKRAK